LVAAAFSQRRKTLRNSLKALLTGEQIVAAGIDPGARAEVISPEQYAALARLEPASH
jgi:16S rRNA (adenine1518-N6/adenine1519-N6)-dimethyltransferase